MKLTRRKAPPEGTGRRVAVAPPPTAAAVAERDAQFLEIWRRVHPSAVELALCRLDYDDACDAAADAMEVILVRWHGLTPGQRTDNWIFGVVHKCIEARRRANRRAKHRFVSIDDAERELETVAATDYRDLSHLDTKAEILDAALAAMPPKRREVLFLVKEQRLTYRQAADVLGLSFGTVKTHLRLAYRDLETAFIRTGFLPESTQPGPALLPAPEGDTPND